MDWFILGYFVCLGYAGRCYSDRMVCINKRAVSLLGLCLGGGNFFWVWVDMGLFCLVKYCSFERRKRF